MPVEIKELHIRINIDSSAGSTTSGSTMVNGGNVPSTESIVAICVEQVMQILKEKAER